MEGKEQGLVLQAKVMYLSCVDVFWLFGVLWKADYRWAPQYQAIN